MSSHRSLEKEATSAFASPSKMTARRLGARRSPTSSDSQSVSQSVSRRSVSLIASDDDQEVFDQLTTSTGVVYRKKKKKSDEPPASPVGEFVKGVGEAATRLINSFSPTNDLDEDDERANWTTDGNTNTSTERGASMSIAAESAASSQRTPLDLRHNDNSFHVMANLVVEFLETKLTSDGQTMVLQPVDRMRMERLLPASLRLDFIDAVRFRLDRTPPQPRTPLDFLTLQCQELGLDRSGSRNPILVAANIGDTALNVPVESMLKTHSSYGASPPTSPPNVASGMPSVTEEDQEEKEEEEEEVGEGGQEEEEEEEEEGDAEYEETAQFDDQFEVNDEEGEDADVDDGGEEEWDEEDHQSSQEHEIGYRSESDERRLVGMADRLVLNSKTKNGHADATQAPIDADGRAFARSKGPSPVVGPDDDDFELVDADLVSKGTRGTKLTAQGIEATESSFFRRASPEIRIKSASGSQRPASPTSFSRGGTTIASSHVISSQPASRANQPVIGSLGSTSVLPSQAGLADDSGVDGVFSDGPRAPRSPPPDEIVVDGEETHEDPKPSGWTMPWTEPSTSWLPWSSSPTSQSKKSSQRARRARSRSPAPAIRKPKDDASEPPSINPFSVLNATSNPFSVGDMYHDQSSDLYDQLEQQKREIALRAQLSYDGSQSEASGADEEGIRGGTNAEALARQQLLAELREASKLLQHSQSPETAEFWKVHVQDLQNRLRVLNGEQPMATGNAESILESNRRLVSEIKEREQHYQPTKSQPSTPAVERTVTVAATSQAQAQPSKEVGSSDPAPSAVQPPSVVDLNGVSGGQQYVPPSLVSSKVGGQTVYPESVPPEQPTMLSLQEPPQREPNYDLPMVDVVAPADLPGGYHFEAEIEGKRFLATVPHGGVQQGETFTCYMRELNSVAIDIPVGYWKDNLSNICDYGCCHSVVWNALFCPLGTFGLCFDAFVHGSSFSYVTFFSCLVHSRPRTDPNSSWF